MRYKIGDPLPFRAVFKESKLGKTGLTVLVYVYDPDDTLIVNGASAREIGRGLYGYDMSGALNTKAGAYTAAFETATATVDSRSEWSLWAVGGWVQNVDQAISLTAPAATALTTATWTNTRAAKLDYLDSAISGVDDLVWAYANGRTLTQPAAAVIAAVSGSVLTLVRGTTWTIALTGLGSLAGNSKIYFTLKESSLKTDAQAIVQVEKTGGLLVLNGATTTTSNAMLVINNEGLGNITITVKPAATTTIESDTLIYDVKMITSTGAAQLLTSNLARIADHITRAIT